MLGECLNYAKVANLKLTTGGAAESLIRRREFE